MHTGRLLSIAVSASKSGPLSTVNEVEAVAGRGLRGDRYFDFTDADGALITTQQITLIESESLAALKRDYDLTIDHPSTRRNLLTQHVALNHLVDQEFSVGPVRLRGLELCEPCGHLERLTVPGIMRALLHRGGLRAEIVAGGLLQVGDTILYDKIVS